MSEPKKFSEEYYRKYYFSLSDVVVCPESMTIIPDIKGNKGEFAFIVKKSVLEEFPNIEHMNLEDIMSQQVFPKYLHNSTGPAIIHLKNPPGIPAIIEVYVDGKQISDIKEAVNFLNNANFHNNVDNLLDE